VLFAAPQPDDRELEVLAEVEDLKLRVRHQLTEPRRWYGALRRTQAARQVRGSNSIEGYDAKLDDAVAILDREAPLDADQETRRVLEGYHEAMTYVLQLANDEDFAYSAQLLKSLHFMMTGYDLQNRPGRWRLGTVYVRKEETGQIVYEGPDPTEVPALIGELVDCLNTSGPEKTLIQASLAHLNLVMIHPFRDGNGRMARCLQSLVLARDGVLDPVFISIEEYLGRNTQAYYDVLAKVGRGSWQPGNDVRPWVRFILTAHLRQARTMLRRIRETELIWTDLEGVVRQAGYPERMLAALYDASMNFRVRNATYRAAIEDFWGEEITEATASRDLQRLVEAQLLVPRGEKRGRYYTVGAVLRQIRDLITTRRNPPDNSDPFAE